MNFWTDEKVEELKTLWPDNTGAAIAEKLGAKSRSAVLAKARKIGLKRPKKEKKEKAVKIKRSPYEGLGQNMKTKGKKAHKDRHAVPSKTPTAIQDLTADTCRFPIGDPKEPGFHFCGAKAKGTYCDHHHKICYGEKA